MRFPVRRLRWPSLERGGGDVPVPSRRGGRVSSGLSGLVALLLVPALAGCGFAAQVVETPTPSPTPAPSLSATLAAARAEVASAIAPAGFQLHAPRVAYRPGESASVAAAPRAVVQAGTSAAPDGGFIVLYELPDAGAAEAAAKEDAAYIGSGIGRVQFPTDSRFVIRQVGSVVVFYTWSPGTSPAPSDEQALATALATLGQGFTVQP